MKWLCSILVFAMVAVVSGGLLVRPHDALQADIVADAGCHQQHAPVPAQPVSHHCCVTGHGAVGMPSAAVQAIALAASPDQIVEPGIAFSLHISGWSDVPSAGEPPGLIPLRV